MALYGLVGCMGVMILILIFFDLASFYMFLQVSPSNYRDILWGFLSFFSFFVFTIKNLRVSGRIVNNSWELGAGCGFLFQLLMAGHDSADCAPGLDRAVARVDCGGSGAGAVGLQGPGRHWDNHEDSWLVVWNIWIMTFHSVGNGKIPTDFHSLHHFSEG